MTFFKRHRRIFFRIALSLLPLYGLIAYLFLPLVWKEYERQPAMRSSPGMTRTADGIPGDPINVGLNGHERDLAESMEAAGWRRAKPLDAKTILEMGESVVPLQMGFRWTEWRNAMDQELQLSFLGERPVADSVAAAHTAIQAVLDRP